MEGNKNDRPKWINTVFRQTVYDILTNTNPIINLKKAVSDLESGNVNPELLKRSNRLSKNPEEYKNENDRKRKIGLAVGERKGDVIEYFESDNKEGYSLNPQDISIGKYKMESGKRHSGNCRLRSRIDRTENISIQHQPYGNAFTWSGWN